MFTRWHTRRPPVNFKVNIKDTLLLSSLFYFLDIKDPRGFYEKINIRNCRSGHYSEHFSWIKELWSRMLLLCCCIKTEIIVLYYLRLQLLPLPIIHVAQLWQRDRTSSAISRKRGKTAGLTITLLRVSHKCLRCSWQTRIIIKIISSTRPSCWIQMSTVMRSTLWPTIRCLWHWPAN